MMSLLDLLHQDLRYALRSLYNDKGLAFGVVLTLTLGLGVNVAVFSLLDQLFVRQPNGVAAPHSVRRAYVTQIDGSGGNAVTDRFNYPQWLDLRSAASPVPMTAYAVDSVPLGSGTGARRIVATYVDSAYWSLLGVHLARGRPFTAAEARMGTPSNLVIVSDAFWRRELGGRSGVVGENLRLGQLVYTVIGVAPRGFTGTELDAAELWLPLGAMPMPGSGGASSWYQIRGIPLLRVLARMRPEINAPAFEARLTSGFRSGSIAAGYRRDTAAVVSSGSIISATGPLSEQPAIVLSTRLPWVSILVLLIACANVANLLLARAMHRERDTAVRLTLGVSRGRLAAQLLLESGLLALIASAAALIVGAWTGLVLRQMLVPEVHWNGGVLDWPLAAVTVCASLVAAAATGLAPLMQAWHLDLTKSLKSGGRAGTRSSGRVRSALVIVQTALAVALLSGAGLFVQGLRRVIGTDVGYDVDRVVIAEPRVMDARGGEREIPRAERASRLTEAAQRLLTSDRGSIQGVALASHGPMGGFIQTNTQIPGLDTLPTLDGEVPALVLVSPEYAKVVGLRPARGRFLTRDDREGAPLVTVVNETMARIAWPGRDPIGQCVKIYGSDGACYMVVGVVDNARQMTVVESPKMQYYVSLAQATPKGGPASPRVLVVRAVAGHTGIAAARVARVLRDVIPSADPGVHPMTTLLTNQFRPWRLGATMLSGLGVLALLVASLGLYALIAFNASRRAHEMSVRMALGASRASLSALIVRDSIRTVVAGIVVGGVLALVGGRLLSALLYDTSPDDPTVLGAVTGVMLVTALLSCLAPGLRAARADPAAALRAE